MNDNRRNGKTARNLILSVVLCAFALAIAIPATYAFFCESFESGENEFAAGQYTSSLSATVLEPPMNGTQENENEGSAQKLLTIAKNKTTLSVAPYENGYMFTSPEVATEVKTATLTVTADGTVDGYTLVTVTQGEAENKTENKYVVVTDSETKECSFTLSFYPDAGTVIVTSESHWGKIEDGAVMLTDLTFGTEDSLTTADEEPQITPPTEENPEPPGETVTPDDETPSVTPDEITETETPPTENNDDNIAQQ